MNSDFIEGFVKAAVSKGLSDRAIARMYKLAMDTSGAGQMFNQMGMGSTPSQAPVPAMQPPGQGQQQVPMHQDPQQMAMIKQLLMHHMQQAGASQATGQAQPL